MISHGRDVPSSSSWTTSPRIARRPGPGGRLDLPGCPQEEPRNTAGLCLSGRLVFGGRATVKGGNPYHTLTVLGVRDGARLVTVTHRAVACPPPEATPAAYVHWIIVRLCETRGWDIDRIEHYLARKPGFAPRAGYAAGVLH